MSLPARGGQPLPAGESYSRKRDGEHRGTEAHPTSRRAGTVPRNRGGSGAKGCRGLVREGTPERASGGGMRRHPAACQGDSSSSSGDTQLACCGQGQGQGGGPGDASYKLAAAIYLDED